MQFRTFLILFYYRNLHGTCGTLLAVNSLAIALYSPTFVIYYVMAKVAPVGIPLEHCFLYLAVPIFFVNCQSILFPAIALDRLLGALFPIWSVIWKLFILFFDRVYSACKILGTNLSYKQMWAGISLSYLALLFCMALLCFTFPSN